MLIGKKTMDTNHIKPCNKGPYNDDRDRIISWYNNFAKKIEQKHLLIIGQSSFLQENIFETSEQLIPNDIILRPKEFSERREFFIDIDSFNCENKRLIYVDDLNLHYSMLNCFFKNITSSIIFKKIPAIITSKKSINITRSFKKLYEIFEIIFIDHFEIENEPVNMPNQIEVLNSEFNSIYKAFDCHII